VKERPCNVIATLERDWDEIKTGRLGNHISDRPHCFGVLVSVQNSLSIVVDPNPTNTGKYFANGDDWIASGDTAMRADDPS
jgi:hypothetical protein